MAPERVERTEEEWKDMLTSEEYHVLREKGTEPAFRNEYWDNHEDGAYFCKGCGQELYTSETKFDSGTGWPSFFAPIEDDRIEITGDDSHGMVRDEVICSRCGCHLGHVFPDGPAPTGERYCMNSVCLDFQQR